MACHTPMVVKRHKYLIAEVKVPCGKCPACKKRRVDSWVFRLKMEERRSFSAYFVTLTYDNNSLPISPHGFPTLDRSHFTNFMKRLRKLSKTKGIKYYAAGEYGSQFKRPHYHAVIFNVPHIKWFAEAWRNHEIEGSPAYGKIDIGTVSGDSIAYTCKYIDKQSQVPQHSRDDRLKEFSTMSKNLGDNYLTDATRKYHLDNPEILYIETPEGFKIALPKYYRDKIFSERPDIIQKQLEMIVYASEKTEEYEEYIANVQGKDYLEWKRERNVAEYHNFYKNIHEKRTSH